MTAIACYVQREHGEPFLWAVADSRVSQLGAFGGNQILNDRATKIFAVPYRVRTGTDAGRVVRAGSFGYCFSGSSLTALNTHALFAHLLRHLRGAECPRLIDIVEFIRGLLHRYVVDYALVAAERAACECAIVGFCPATGRPEIYVLSPEIVDGEFRYHVEIGSLDDGSYVLLGDAKPEVRALIEQAKARYNPGSINWWRAPWHGINAAIVSGQFPSIGGQVQLGVGGRGEFTVIGRMEPGGGPIGYEFLGIDTGTRVGPCRLGIPYMAGLEAFQRPEHR